MRTINLKFKKFNREILILLTAIALAVVLATVRGHAQSCVGLPSFPTSGITTTQDRDQMMCQQGLTFPSLPVRSGTAWPWNDPTAPTNARPSTLSSPEGNWTDAQGHTIVRTAWGNWHTYDADPIYEPNPSQHYNPGSTTWPFPSLNGGALSGVGDYGPESSPRYPDIDLFKMVDGTSVLSREDWWIKRRPEIFNLVQQEFYGRKWDPSEWPAITWSVGSITTGTQNGVAYRQKTITGTISKATYPALRNTPVITLQCRTPAAKAGQKAPVFIQNGGSASTVFGFTATAGFGGCGYSNTALQPDSGGANLSSYIIGLVNKGNWRKPDDPGALVAWAWGISRLIDYFASDPDIDEDKVAVEGHSRYGKATLIAAAYDDRVVAAFPSCGGSMGTSWARRHYGESLSFVSGSTSEYHWLNGKVMNYAGPINPGVNIPGKVQNLDVDVHSVMSLIAPRAVMTNGGSDTPAGNGDAWQDPRGMFLAGKYSGPVWQLLGWAGQVIPPGTVFTSPGSPGTGLTAGPAESTRGTPPFNVAFIDGTVGWRRHSEGHTDAPDWPTFVTFASRYLNDKRPVITAGQNFTLPSFPSNVLGMAVGTDGDAADTLQHWQVTGGTGAYTFQINEVTGQITIPDRSKLNGSAHAYTLTLMVGDGKLPSHVRDVTINVPADTAAPVLDLATLPSATGECSARITGPPPTATDAYVGPVTGSTTDPLSYSTQGEHVVTWKYNDGHGNVSMQTQKVIVKDVTAPVPDAASLTTVTGECSATIPSAPRATDNCAGSITGTTSDPLTYTTQGTFTVHWTYDDCNGNQTAQTQTVIVHDTTAPVPNVSVLPTITGECSATIPSAPKATDNCAGSITGTTSDPLVYTTQGTFAVHWTYNDGNGNQSTQNQTVVVHDTTPPTFQGLTASPNVLWSPNHQMVAVSISAVVTDACDSAPVTRIIGVASNEPINGTGDGDTAPDWEITGNLTLNLRAERAGNGNGRVYTITVESRDASGNASIRTVTVTVPHN